MTSVRTCVTSVSWIPSEAVVGPTKLGFTAGLTHYDPPPPDVLGDLASLRAADGFRFAHRLEVAAQFDGDRLVDHEVHGGLVLGSTTVGRGPFGVTFAAVPMPELDAPVVLRPGEVVVRRTCGGRTALPLPRKISRPPFVRLQAPLVWTTLEVVLRADGSTSAQLVGASPFPRHWVYDDAGQLSAKAGLADFSTWAEQESHAATPWGDEDTEVLVTDAESALERGLSGLIMHGGSRPRISQLAAGELLVRQGQPGDEVYLLLDGVLVAEVDGEAVAELGPGAVVGERAALEGGRRTATLRARTPVRVAGVAAGDLGSEDLRQLATLPRREGDTGR